jgi:hypothetical protein
MLGGFTAMEFLVIAELVTKATKHLLTVSNEIQV